MSIGRVGLVLTIGLVAVLSAAPAVAQCAMCRRALASPEGQQMIAALRSGIAVLLVTPFALFAAVAALAVRGDRRRRERATGSGLRAQRSGPA